MRYHALDAWRGIGALVIAASRLDIDAALWHLPMVRYAYPLVDFFFVLSGFVITHAYFHRLDGSARAAGGFVVRRFGRIWPLHAFTLALLVAIEAGKLAMVAAGVDSRSVPFTAEQSPSTILSSLFLLQAMGLHTHAVWNTPAWSISVEFWTYLVFLAAVMLARSRLVLISLVLVVVSIAVLTRAPHGMESTFDYGFWRCLAGFFVGHLVYRLHRATLVALPEDRAVWTAIELASIAGLCAWLMLAHGTMFAYLAPVAMGVIVFVFAAERGAVSELVTGSVGRALGAWSYSIYLVCPLIAYVIERSVTLLERSLGQPLWRVVGADRLISFGSPSLNTAALFAYLGAVVLVSALTYRFVEEPARRWFYARAARFEAGKRQERTVPAE
jgi:peptidoglycan/LPS O-acetylase OafA/YrhL